MKNKKGKFIVSLLTVFMMVFTVIPYMGAMTAEADSDPYVYENASWGGISNLIKEVKYNEQSNGTFTVEVFYDTSQVDPQLLVNEVQAMGYQWCDSSNIIRPATNGSFNPYVTKDSIIITNNGVGFKPGEVWKVRIYLAPDYYADEELDYSFAWLTLTAPQLKASSQPEISSRYTEVTVEKSTDGSYYIQDAKYVGDDSITAAIYRENLSTGKFMCVTIGYDYAWDSNNMKPNTEYKYYVVNQNHLKETGYPTDNNEIDISLAARTELNKYSATATIKTDPIKVANVTDLKVYKKGLKYVELRWFQDSNVYQGFLVQSYNDQGKVFEEKVYYNGITSGNTIYVPYSGTTYIAVRAFLNDSETSTIYGEPAVIPVTSAKLTSPSVNITKISSKNARITVYKTGDGIQVQQKVGKKWKNVTTGSKAATYKKTWTKNSAGKTTYRVRAYIKDQGETYYTKWKEYKPKTNYRTYSKVSVKYLRDFYEYGDVFFFPTKVQYKGSKIKVTGRFYNTWMIARDSGKFKITYKADGKTIGYKTISVKNMKANSYKTTSFYLTKSKKNADLRCASYTLNTLK